MQHMRYVAKIRKVAVRRIHKVAIVEDGRVRAKEDLLDPHRVEIELDGCEAKACIMYRYTDDGRFCGDTWHPSFEEALEQAKYEYGLERSDFSPM